VTTTTTGTRTYKIDKSHSEAIFQVRHLVTKVRGRFTDFEGSIDYNDANPEQSSVNFSINSTSIDTAEPDRDKHLRSADFFEVEKYPQITFRSSRIVKRGAETYDVTGTLTIRDVSREIVLPVAHMGKAKDPWGGDRLGFEAETTINRKDYGLTFNIPLAETGGFLVGDEVKISLEIQAVGQ
jgi:polyisoprenoid-binding protein YceI